MINIRFRLYAALFAFWLLLRGPLPILAQETAFRVYVANTGSDTVSILEGGPQPTVAATLPGFSRPWGVAASPDGSRVYVTNSGSDSVTVIDGTTQEVLIPAVGVGTEPRGVAVAPDGTVYVANFGSNSVSVLDSEREYAAVHVAVGAGPEGVAVGGDGTAYVTNSQEIGVAVIRPAGALRPRMVTRLALDGLEPRGIAASPDGKSLYVAAADLLSTLYAFELPSTRLLRKLPLGDEDATASPPGVAASPDGRYVYVADLSGGAVSVVSVETLSEVARAPMASPFGLAVSPDSRWVYVTHNAGQTVSILDAETREVVGTVEVGESPAGVAVTPP
jgi:YVTN family beta-propeller protein